MLCGTRCCRVGRGAAGAIHGEGGTCLEGAGKGMSEEACYCLAGEVEDVL